MRRLQLSFKHKLLLGIAASLLVVFGIGGIVGSYLVQERLLAQASQGMEITGQGIHAMVRGLVTSAIKNYLKGISETNLAYVQHVYERFKAGEIGEAKAKALAEEFMLKQKVGSSGYVTAVDVSNGGIRLAVHPHSKGKDISKFDFAQRMASQRNGYLEFEWKNPGDTVPRLKAEWMSFFEPWQWIINAAPFRDEYAQIVDLAGIEAELDKVAVPGQGYAFIMDMQGRLLAHPSWKGRNMFDAADADTGERFVRNMVESVRRGWEANAPDRTSGQMRYRVTDSTDGRVYSRIMNYRYVPETDWIVGVVTDLDQLEAPLRVIRNMQLVVMTVSLLMAFFVIAWAVRPMTRSIDALALAVECIDGGNLATPLPALGRDEIGRLSDAFRRMAERLVSYTEGLEQRVMERTAELNEANRKLAELSITDALTGLANRRRFDEVLATEWSRAGRSQRPLALLMLDVDYFKKYNDRYGHQAGDVCLQNVARVIQTAARRAGDLPARYGGEEFAVIAADTDLESATALAENIRLSVEALALPHLDSSQEIVTVSIGVHVLSAGMSDSMESLLRAADAALYRAKREGRNRVAAGDPS